MRKLILLFFLVTSLNTFSQPKKVVYPIAFYNVENLFDTDRDFSIDDEDFTPTGRYKWTIDRYKKKLSNLSEVISLLGKDESTTGFAILGVAEVENRRVIEDLISTPKLSPYRYKFVHQDSPDRRGIDVALIYNPNLFTVSSYKIYPFSLPGANRGGAIKTRDILVVNGKLGGEELTVLVNHWPSRGGENSELLRERAGEICKHICDSLYRLKPSAGIIVMGDMNDDPKDKSTSIALGAKRQMEDVRHGELFNTMWRVHDKGIGSLRYRGSWNLFDQIIISESLLKWGKCGLSYKRSYVFNKKFLIQQSGAYRGYPLRTFQGTSFLNGYSDHFPTLIYLTM